MVTWLGEKLTILLVLWRWWRWNWWWVKKMMDMRAWRSRERSCKVLEIFLYNLKKLKLKSYC